MNTSQLAEGMREDQVEDGGTNTYEDAASLSGLYPADGGDGDDKIKYPKLFFLQDACLFMSSWSVFQNQGGGKIEVSTRPRRNGRGYYSGAAYKQGAIRLKLKLNANYNKRGNVHIS